MTALLDRYDELQARVSVTSVVEAASSDLSSLLTERTSARALRGDHDPLGTDAGRPGTEPLPSALGQREPIRLPRLADLFGAAAPRYFLPTNQWEGVVEEIGTDTFFAQVIDLVSEDEATVEFPLDDLTADDKELFRVGARFYWAIGYRVDRGVHERASRIWFRRIGVPRQ